MARCSFTILLAAGVFAAGTTLGSANDLALCRKADSDEALQACERALAADLVDKAEVATAYRSRGNQHYRAGDIERAKAAFADMLRHDPNNSAFYLGRAATYLRNGQFDRAIVEFSEAIRRDPLNAVSFNSRGVSYIKVGDCERAIADFNETIRLKPDQPMPYNNRGHCYVSLNQYDAAMADLNKAISLAPQNALAFKNRALAHELKGELAEAIGDLRVALAINPALEEAKDTLQRVQQKLSAGATPRSAGARSDDLALCRDGWSGKAPEACERALAAGLVTKAQVAQAYRWRANRGAANDRQIADYSRAIEFDPDSAAAYLSRGSAYRGLKQYQRAIDDYTTALRINPDNAQILVARSATYFDLQDCDRAIADLDKALRLAPENFTAYSLRGQCYVKKNQISLGLADLSEAIARASERPHLWNERAAAHEQNGKLPEAIADLHVSVTLDANAKDASEALKPLQDKLNVGTASVSPRIPAKDDAARKSKGPHFDRLQNDPLQFYLAKGEPDACGEGCSEWIAAEGSFDSGAAERLRGFLKRLGGRKLPIFFHSTGGLGEQALAIGRLLRAQGMTAGVSRTIPDACRSVKADACRAAKRSGQVLTADLVSLTAYCYSACGYALIGAKLRLVPPGAQLGVHLGATISKDGQVRKTSQRNAAERANDAKLRDRWRQYVREMGIDGALSDAIEKVPFEHLRFLSRDEIARFRIDRRDFLESRWENLPAQPSTIAKLVVEAKRPNSNAFRTSLIRLVCGGAGKLLVGYIRSFDEAEQLTTIKLAAGQDEIRLQNVGYINEIPVRADGTYVEGTFATIRFFDRAAMANGLEIAPVASSNSEASKQQPVKLSVAGLAESLATLRRSCR